MQNSYFNIAERAPEELWTRLLVKSLSVVKLSPRQTQTRTIGDVGDFTQNVVSADLFISLWWADECLADHGNVDFGTDTPAWRLQEEGGELRRAAASLSFIWKVNKSIAMCVWKPKKICVQPLAHLCVVVVHREIADQPGVWIVFIVGQDLPHGGQVQHVPLRRRPHALQHTVCHQPTLKAMRFGVLNWCFQNNLYETLSCNRQNGAPAIYTACLAGLISDYITLAVWPSHSHENTHTVLYQPSTVCSPSYKWKIFIVSL